MNEDNLPAVEKNSSVVTTPFPCPNCRKLSDSVKCYRAGVVIFVVFFVAARTKPHVGCPSCIRKTLLGYGALNIVTANLIWPIIILPITLAYLLASLTRGHSDEICRQIDPDYLEKELARIEAESGQAEPSAIAYRIEGTLKIVFGLTTAVSALYWVGLEWYRWSIETWAWGGLGTVAAGMAVSAVFSGLSNLRVREPSWKAFFVRACIAGVVFLAACPVVGRFAWNVKAAEHKDIPSYTYDVPPRFWREQPVRRFVSFKKEVYLKSREDSGRPSITAKIAAEDLETVLQQLRTHHEGEPGFDEISAEIIQYFNEQGYYETKLVEYLKDSVLGDPDRLARLVRDALASYQSHPTTLKRRTLIPNLERLKYQARGYPEIEEMAKQLSTAVSKQVRSNDAESLDQAE